MVEETIYSNLLHYFQVVSLDFVFQKVAAGREGLGISFRRLNLISFSNILVLQNCAQVIYKHYKISCQFTMIYFEITLSTCENYVHAFVILSVSFRRITLTSKLRK